MTPAKFAVQATTAPGASGSFQVVDAAGPPKEEPEVERGICVAVSRQEEILYRLDFSPNFDANAGPVTVVVPLFPMT